MEENTRTINNEFNVEVYVWDFLFTPEMLMVAKWCIHNVVIPSFAVAGIAGNIFSLIVLIRSGLDSPSNILLLQLTLANIFTLVDGLNFLHNFSNSLAWETTYPEAMVLSTIVVLMYSASHLGRTVSAYAVLWITVERLVAIFFPLRFTSIVTVRRAGALGSLTFLLQLFWVVFSDVAIYRFHYGLFSNFTGGVIANYAGDHIYFTIEKYFLTNCNYPVPMALVILGCIAIAVKLSTTRQKRGLMAPLSKSQKSARRTTKTLLIVCIFFCATRATFFVDYFSLQAATSFRLKVIYFIITLISLVLMYFGASTDCIIYIFFNKKYRKTIKRIFWFNSYKEKQ